MGCLRRTKDVVLQHGDLAVDPLDFCAHHLCVLFYIHPCRVLLVAHLRGLLCEVELRARLSLALAQDLTLSQAGVASAETTRIEAGSLDH